MGGSTSKNPQIIEMAMGKAKEIVSSNSVVVFRFPPIPLFFVVNCALT
jgi:hypothetical protein